MSDISLVEGITIYVPIFLLSITVHEFFHAWSANKFGDPTAKNLGRLSLMPHVHLDLLGTAVFFLSQFTFGWAKPVPVNPFNLKNPARDDFWISFAGPLSNFGQAIIFGFLFQVLILNYGLQSSYFQTFFQAGVLINLVLAFFNLIPLFPLDGSHMLRYFVPDKYDAQMEQFERYSPFLLLFFFFTGIHSYILGPLIGPMYRILLGY